MRSFLRVSSLRDRRKSSEDLAQHLAASSGCQVDHSPVKEKLDQEWSLWKGSSQETTFSEGEQGERKRYAKAHEDWNDDRWKRVLWSDQSKFDIFGSNRKYVRRKVGDKRMSACGLQWNMVEGLSWFGPAFLPVVLLILSELMGSWMLKKYRRVLIHHAIPSGKAPDWEWFYFSAW